MIDLPDLNPTGEDLGKPGWRYADMPNLDKEHFDKYVGILGEENIHWLTLAERRWPDGTITWRGQHLISPEGQARGAAYAKDMKP